MSMPVLARCKLTKEACDNPQIKFHFSTADTTVAAASAAAVNVGAGSMQVDGRKEANVR